MLCKVLSFQVFVRACRRPCLLPEDYVIKDLVRCDRKEKQKVTQRLRPYRQTIMETVARKKTLSVIVLDRLLKTTGTGLERITRIL